MLHFILFIAGIYIITGIIYNIIQIYKFYQQIEKEHSNKKKLTE